MSNDTRRYARITPLLELARTRLRQGTKTSAYPAVPITLPERFRGRPALDPSRCTAAAPAGEGVAAAPGACRACVDACPTGAIALDPLRIDLGACLFCPACTEACAAGAVAFTPDHRLAASAREDLVFAAGDAERLAHALGEELQRVLGRSLKLRQVSAGGCNSCEAELNVLNTPVYDLARFGIQFVASPRHADGIVITGPVTDNMRKALLDTWEAIPGPKIAVAVGACAIAGGPFRGEGPHGNGVPPEIPIDLYVPGCPPHPYTTLDGLLRIVGRLR